jgi:hypothetical protein
MIRNYYSINEAAAKQAKSMMSFDDYKEGSKTATYKSYCDEVYNLAEKVIEERPTQAERIEALADRYARKMADNINQELNISCRCPSVMIAGPGNFPVRKKQKQIAAWEKNAAEFKEIQKIKDKIESIYYGKDIIKAGDADAIEQLTEKIQKLEADQARMKEANKAIRLKDTAKGDKKLSEMGYSERDITELRKPDFCGRVGYPGYMLTNNNANIKRLKGRLSQLEKAKIEGTKEEENELFKVVENTEIMRLQLIFDGKPEPEIREVLKSNGFKWAPSQGAWQRQLTSNARYALDRVRKALQV